MEGEIADLATSSSQPPVSQVNGNARPEAMIKERELNATRPEIVPDVAEAAKNLTLDTRPEEVQAVSSQVEQAPKPEAAPTHEESADPRDKRPTEVKIVEAKIDHFVGSALDIAVSKLNGSAKPEDETKRDVVA